MDTVDVVLTAAAAPDTNFSNRVAVVIDVLRATTSLTAVFESGVSRVYPVAEVEEARSMYRGLNGALLCGERHGVRIEGFDYGNSPSEFAKLDLSGKAIVLTTTNGTGAVLASRKASKIFAASIRNAAAVARRICAEHLGESVSLVCAGTEGSFSIEDFYAAGLVAAVLKEHGWRLRDLAAAAALIARESPTQVINLETCFHFGTLSRLGLEADLDYCLALDVSEVVPVYDPDDGSFSAVLK